MRFTWRYLQDLRIKTTSTKFADSRNHFMGSSSLLKLGLIDSLKWSRRMGIYKDKPITSCSQSTRVAILVVYVDSIIVIGSYLEEMKLLKEILTREFEIKDLGNLKYFLGMEVVRSKKGIVVSQCKYVMDLLKETRMLGCKPTNTPLESTTKLGLKEDSSPVDKGRYQRLVGKLIYLFHTRSDIGFPVSVVSQFMNNPNEEHLKVVYRILRSLKMTLEKDCISEREQTRKLKST